MCSIYFAKVNMFTTHIKAGHLFVVSFSREKTKKLLLFFADAFLANAPL